MGIGNHRKKEIDQKLIIFWLLKSKGKLLRDLKLKEGLLKQTYIDTLGMPKLLKIQKLYFSNGNQKFFGEADFLLFPQETRGPGFIPDQYESDLIKGDFLKLDR